MIKELGMLEAYDPNHFVHPITYEYVFIVPDGIKSLMSDIGYGIEMSKGIPFPLVMENGPQSVTYEECKKEAIALFKDKFESDLETYIDGIYGVTKKEENEKD